LDLADRTDQTDRTDRTDPQDRTDLLVEWGGAFAVGVGGAAPELAALALALAGGAERHELAAVGAFGDLLGRIGQIRPIRPIFFRLSAILEY